MANHSFVISALAALAAISGCASSQKEKEAALTWRPRPVVDWSRVSTVPVAPPREGFRIVAAQPTQGLFPSNMGITRVALRESSDPLFGGPQHDPTPVILKDPRNEFLYWNFALDDQMAVSEVFPIDQFALGGGDARPEQIVAAFRALGARLGLIYAVNELGPTQAEMIGTLYDTRTASPIAHFHARAVSVLPPIEEKDQPPNLWKTDARARVRAKFQEMVHACTRALIQTDQPAAIESPTGWVPVGPIQPVDWPPRHHRDRDN